MRRHRWTWLHYTDLPSWCHLRGFRTCTDHQAGGDVTQTASSGPRHCEPRCRRFPHPRSISLQGSGVMGSDQVAGADRPGRRPGLHQSPCRRTDITKVDRTAFVTANIHATARSWSAVMGDSANQVHRRSCELGVVTNDQNLRLTRPQKVSAIRGNPNYAAAEEV